MRVRIHPAHIMLCGDERGYNPRGICVTLLPGGQELLTGVFRDDGVGSKARAERPFRIVICAGFEAWQFLNTQVFYALQANSAEINIDAT